MNTISEAPSADTPPFDSWQPAIDEATRRGDLHLHIGCGKHVMDGWINIDGHPHPGAMQMTLPQGLSGFAGDSAHDIGHCIDALLAQDYPNSTAINIVIVVTSPRTRDTNFAVLERIAAKDKRLLVMQRPTGSQFASTINAGFTAANCGRIGLLAKHGIDGDRAGELMRQKEKWYGEPVYRVLQRYQQHETESGS